MFGYFDAPEVSILLALEFSEPFQKGRSVVFELGRYLNIFSPLLFQGFFRLILHGLVLRHFRTFWCGLVLDSSFGTVTVSRSRARGVRATLFFNVNYFL